MDGSLTDADCGKLSRQETEAGGRKRLNIRIGNQEIRIGDGNYCLSFSFLFCTTDTAPGCVHCCCDVYTGNQPGNTKIRPDAHEGGCLRRCGRHSGCPARSSDTDRVCVFYSLRHWDCIEPSDLQAAAYAAGNGSCQCNYLLSGRPAGRRKWQNILCCQPFCGNPGRSINSTHYNGTLAHG